MTPSREPEPTCPRCGETRLIEFDPVLKRFVCKVCATDWREADQGTEVGIYVDNL
jgi:hypothetical protein